MDQSFETPLNWEMTCKDSALRAGRWHWGGNREPSAMGGLASDVTGEALQQGRSYRAGQTASPARAEGIT